MGRPGFRDLVARAITDEDFRAELVRAPAEVLARFELTDEEHAAVMKAASRSPGRSDREHAQSFQSLMVRRWAT